MSNKGKFIGGLLVTVGLGVASSAVGFFTSKWAHDATIEAVTEEVTKNMMNAAETVVDAVSDVV